MADSFLSLTGFALSVTLPIFILLFLGSALKKIDVINDDFVNKGSALVFKVALPCLLFVKISQNPLSDTANIELIIYAAVATVVVYVLLEVAAFYLISPKSDQGIFVQGAFRANMGIVGLAYIDSLYGVEGLVAAALYLGLITVLFNILSVLTLTRSLNRQHSTWGILSNMARNPLIISIVLALIVSFLKIPIPAVLLQTSQYFSQLALPLALLCTGAALSLQALQHDLYKTLLAGFFKLVWVPALITGGGWYWGFRGMDLDILFLMSSAPTAAASFIMVQAMQGNARFAAGIIGLTTLGSVISSALGLVLLRLSGLSAFTG